MANTTTSTAPMTRSLADDATLAAWLEDRQKHAVPRLVSLLVTTVIGLSAASVVPPPWGLLALALPVFTVVTAGQVVTWWWCRRGLRLGLRRDEIAELRRTLMALPARVPLYSGEELLTHLRAKMPLGLTGVADHSGD